MDKADVNTLSRRGGKSPFRSDVRTDACTALTSPPPCARGAGGDRLHPGRLPPEGAGQLGVGPESADRAPVFLRPPGLDVQPTVQESLWAAWDRAPLAGAAMGPRAAVTEHDAHLDLVATQGAAAFGLVRFAS